MAVPVWKSAVIGARLKLADGLTHAAADLATASDPAFPTFPAVTQFSVGDGFATAPSSFAASVGLKVRTLVSFTGTHGKFPVAGLIADAAGDLFGTTNNGGANSVGTVFEIVKTADGYATTPTILVSCNYADGAFPDGSLIADAAGDLFGTTSQGGANGYGTVFEIVKTSDGYASTPTTLVSFNYADGAEPSGSLIADAAGNLFGTTSQGGANDYGTVFEIVKTADGYASTPTTLVSFNSADGERPLSSLIADSTGDLFGTTYSGGANGYDGTVFEIVKTADGYATTPTTLVSFNGADGANPEGGLITDAAGDLFGTAYVGGAGRGTVFEIVKTADGYASTPTTLVSFNSADGAMPCGSLIADAAGDLFGTTIYGGANGGYEGTVFEIVKTADGYATTPTILVSFRGKHGKFPVGSLLADAAGDLFGTTSEGGAYRHGLVFEIKNSGFVTQPELRGATTTVAPISGGITPLPPLGAAFVQAMAAHGPSRFASGASAILAPRNETPTLLCRP